MQIEKIVKEISLESLSSNERELLEKFRSLDETEKIALMHLLYTTAFDSILSEIRAENVKEFLST